VSIANEMRGERVSRESAAEWRNTIAAHTKKYGKLLRSI
jgi:hypothetical protein